ncbi:Uncharacterized protein dnm_079490 [Desulfonema magnum]|uniref:Uncharacterized protein n=1 Tax=Desulfonema magnum TaxID=45655 RepID=A0A975GSB2_9BACT|nr:Uncharacterized protein dnm_079490 [Desulfonema magnum]
MRIENQQLENVPDRSRWIDKSVGNARDRSRWIDKSVGKARDLSIPGEHFGILSIDN